MIMRIGLLCSFVLLLTPAALAAPDSMPADVFIRARGNVVTIAVDRHNRQSSDGFVDIVYRYRSEMAFEPLEIVIKHAQLESEPRRLLISAPNLQRAFLFDLADATAPEEWFHPSIAVTRFRGGFELSRRTVPADSRYSLEALQNGRGSGGPVTQCCPGTENPEPGDGELGAGMTCDSGGRGSTSCSVEAYILGSGGSCSTSCTNGYYACCSLTKGCKCIKY